MDIISCKFELTLKIVTPTKFGVLFEALRLFLPFIELSDSRYIRGNHLVRIGGKIEI